MSKQDIEKRLGFAAQGVKAEMAHIPGITGEAYEPNPQGTHRYKVGDQVKDKRHPSFQGTIKRLMRDKYGYPSYVVYTQGGGPQDAQDSDLVLASRPGVKIKFSAQFEVGRVYEHSFIGDYDAIVQWKVLSRTESTLTIKKVGEGNRNSATTPTRGEEKRVKINSDAQGEFVYPMGKFSMAPILRASKTTASRPGVKATFAEFNVGDKVVYVPDSRHIDAYGRIIKIENGIAIIASAEGNVKAKLSDLELVKKGSVEDLRRLGMKGFARPGAKAKMETPMRVALTPMHTRAEQGYENFIAVLMKFGGITREQAQKAFKAFKDAKVLVTKEQYMGGGITVKHGAFMERDVIRRAAGLPEESSRPGVKAKA